MRIHIASPLFLSIWFTWIIPQCTGQYQNNRAEYSHQLTRQKERQMRRFKSPGHAQRFLSSHGPINDLFRYDRHLLSARAYREYRSQGFTVWDDVTGVVPAV